jgi:NitT/TauT family transport system substrate-binding protein
MKASKTIRRVFVVVVSLMLISFMVGPSYAKELLPLKVSYLPIIDLLQFYVAMEKGFFEEEGLKVEGQKAPGGAVSQTLVESGSVDLGWTAVVPLSQAYVKGFDFAFIAPGGYNDRSNRSMVAIAVRKDSPIKSIKDLAGKKIAVNGIQSVNHLSVLAISDFHGVDTKEMKFLEVPFPNQPVALKEGAVDAASLNQPFLAFSEAEGVTRQLYPSFFPPEIAERNMIASWFAKKSSLEKNKDKIERFLRAINKATDFINKNPDQMPEIIAKNTKLDVNLLQKVTLPKFYTKVYKKDIQLQIDLCAKYDFIKKGFDAKEIVATELVPLE